MSSFLTVIPKGFFAANETLNALPEAVVYQLTYDCLDALFDKAAAPVADSYMQLLTDSKLTSVQVQSAINAVTHIFRSAQNVKSVTINPTLESDSMLKPHVITLLSDAWTALSQEGVLVRRAQKNRAGPSAASGAAGARTLQVGKLLSIGWRVGLGVASSACADLSAPFVTLQLQLVDSFGKMQTKSMELSVAQFQEFAKNFNDIASRLDTI